MNVAKYTQWICVLIIIAFSIMTVVKLTAKYLQPEVPPDSANDIILCSCNVRTFYEKEWGTYLSYRVKPLTNPIKYIVIKHTGGNFCQTTEECKVLTKKMQKRDIALNYSDIGYNFLVGGDGNIYVGRGFLVENQSNNRTYDIAIHGNFLYDQFYSYMENATMTILNYGVDVGHIVENYVILCHNQTEHVDSPGRNVYEKVIHWDHYSNMTLF